MFVLYDASERPTRFKTKTEMERYVEARHTEEGGFDWISEIKDEHGNSYGCSWKVTIEAI